jgi:hypothetical protein
MMHRICTFTLQTSTVAFGQLPSNTVVVTASRTLSVQPDQVVFGVTVNSGIGASLTSVLAALQPLGITAANFSGISTSTFSTGVVQMASVQWGFTLPVAFANMQTTVAALTSLQQSITQNNSGFTLSFSVGGTQVSQQLQQMQVCPLSQLLSDAQTQAEALAYVAGFKVGSVLAMSSSTSNATSNGDASLGVLGVVSYVQSYTAPPVCSMTVKFSLAQ